MAVSGQKSADLQVALIQMEVAAGEPEVNFARVEQWMERALTGPVKPDVLVLPEMWNTGYALDRIAELADPDGRRTEAVVGSFCRRHGVMAVAGSIAERTGEGTVRNTVLAFDRQGRVTGRYSKIHLFRLMQEEKALVAGHEPGLLQLEGTRAGTAVCYDIRFPELARTLALSGARLLIVPAEWPNPRLHHWRTLLQARAIENQMYVVACNRTGISGDTSFFGHSMVIDPWGEVVAEAGEEEGILTARLQLGLVDEVRSRIPVFEDRRPELYRLEVPGADG